MKIKNFGFLLATIFLSALILCACDSKSEKKMPEKAAEVDVALPLKKKITEWNEYTGRFQAMKEVDIRSRVTGYLQEIKFKDGQLIHEGDVLFIIDKRPFDYALQRAQAQYELATRQYDRALKLQKNSFISAEVIDQRLQEKQVAETNLSDAKLNVEFTSITSPINGKISRHFVSVGNLVQMNTTILTRVVSVDPIYFYFETSQRDLLNYIRLDRAGKLPSADKSANPIDIKLMDEHDFIHHGKTDFIDNIIDQGTGTILVRAIVPNPDALIYPGLFGRARLIGSGEFEALLVPDSAINTDQNRKFVYIVDSNNRVQRVYIELGPVRPSGYYIIRAGLNGNERIVVNGIQRIHQSNQEVKPLMTTLTE